MVFLDIFMENVLIKVLKVSLILLIFVISFIGNVYLHEGGHYAAAGLLGLNPNIEISSIGESVNYILESKPVASVSFEGDASKGEMFLVGLMGPFMNILLSFVFLIIYFANKQNEYVRKFAVAGLIPSILSFIVNILPFEGTDGNILLSLSN